MSSVASAATANLLSEASRWDNGVTNARRLPGAGPTSDSDGQRECAPWLPKAASGVGRVACGRQVSMRSAVAASACPFGGTSVPVHGITWPRHVITKERT